jgi:Domain of unknown function (DUF4340)
MKTRNLISAALVLCALAGVLYWSEHRKSSGAGATVSADTPPSILKLDEAAVAKLAVKKKDADPIVLEKDGSGTWRIAAPKPLGADQSTVSSAVSALGSLNSERLVEDKATDLKRYGLDQPALNISITEKNNKSKELQLGDDTPTGNAVYAKLAGDPRIFTISSYVKSNVDKTLGDFRDKRLLTVTPDKISRIQLLKKNQDIEFGRDKNDWQIIKPRPMRADISQVTELMQKLIDARMDLGASDSKSASSAFAKAAPVASARLTDQSGTQELQLRKNKDSYYAKSSVVDGVYKVGSEVAQPLEKSLNDFRNKKVFDFGFDDPNKIEFHSGSKLLWLDRNGDDWWLNGKKLDENAVQALVAKLRDLSAQSFPESGFKTPEIEVTVTSDNGKRREKTAFSKSGSDYIAKRDNDTSLYQLNSSSVEELQKAADAIKPANTSSK